MKKYIPVLEISSRIYVAFILCAYGLGKIVGGQFHRRGELPEEVAVQTLANANGYDLAWTFMGFSHTYIIIIGSLQIIGAIALLFDKTKFIGITILIPILLNIIIFDAIFFRANDYGALASAVLYFSLLVFILILNKEKSKALISQFISSSQIKWRFSYRGFLMLVTIIALIFGLDQCLIHWFGILPY